MKSVVIYHGNCADGWGAAMAAKCHPDWKDAEYVASQYGDPPPDVKGKRVLIVDFSYPRKVLEEMAESTMSLMVIDHHKTAKEELSGLPYVVFDMNQSGAMMTWKLLHPVNQVTKNVYELLAASDDTQPALIRYVQDRDLWTWKLPHSKEISAALRSYPMDFKTWVRLLHDNEMTRLASEGAAILRYQNNVVARAITTWKHNPQYEQIGGHTVPVMNCTALISEICGELSRGHLFAATYIDGNGKRFYSLRTTNKEFDCSSVARLYGGGGHAGAAGFTVTI